MRGALLFLVCMALSFTASCVRSPIPSRVMLASAGDVVPLSTATDAPAESSTLIEMPPVYVDAKQDYALKIERASADATDLCARLTKCPAVRVRRADLYEQADGTAWTVVRLSACGEERVYEKTRWGWNDATWRLR
jgi:hypothetical protein